MARKKTPKTKKDKTIAGLLTLGWTEGDGTSKYQSFTHSKNNRRWLVGKSGALRSLEVGEPIAKSLSCTDSRSQKGFVFVGEHTDLCPDEATAEKLYRAFLDKTAAHTTECILERFATHPYDCPGCRTE